LAREFNREEAFHVRNLIMSNQMKFATFPWFDPKAKLDKHDKINGVFVWALMNQYARRCWAKKSVVFVMRHVLAAACGCSKYQVLRLQRAAVAEGLLKPIIVDGEQKRSRLGAPQFFVDADAIEAWLAKEPPTDFQVELASRMRSVNRSSEIDPEDAEEERLMYEAEELSVGEEDDGQNTVEEFLDRSASN
jgi:hypothetical protein